MADSREGVEAIVLAAGQGDRLGLGPKAFLRLAGKTLLDRAIGVMRSVAERVIVGVPEELVGQVQAIHAGPDVLVLAGGPTRLDTTRRLLAASSAPLIVQHDVVHPFVGVALARQVVAAARRRGAAMAVAPVAEHVFRADGDLVERVSSTGGLWLARKPLAFARGALRLTEAPRDGDSQTTSAPAPLDAGTPELLFAAGQPVAIVPVKAWNIKISSPPDWALAQAIDALWRAGQLDDGPDGPGTG